VDQDPQNRPFRRITPKCIVEEENQRRRDLPPAPLALVPAAAANEARGSGSEDLHRRRVLGGG
jgi:hypothetical protein